MSWSCSTYQVQLVENSLDLFINWSVVQLCFHWPDLLMCWGDWAELPQHFPGGLFLGHFCLDRFLPVHELWGKRNLLQRFCITVYDFYGKLSSLHVILLPFFPLSWVTSQPLVPEFQPLCTSFPLSAVSEEGFVSMTQAYEAWMLVRQSEGLFTWHDLTGTSLGV